MEPNILDYPNSQEGIDAYEADLAEYNRIQKGPMIGTEFVDTVENVVESGIEQISKVPIFRTGLQFLGGAVKTVDQVMSQDQGPGGMVYRTYKNVKEASEEGFGDLAENLGVDRRIGEFGGGEVVDFVATAGVGTVAKRAKNVIDKLPPGGMSSQLATAGTSQINISRGAVNYQPPTVAKLTITDPEFIAPGVKPGIAQTPANIKAREMLDKSLERLDKRRSELDSMLESGEVVKGSTKFARLDKKIREERYGEMSSFYNNLDQDPPAYRKKTDKNIDPTNEAVVLEQHHLAAKAQTQPFVEVMLEVGDPDDLAALHEYSRMLGVVMGNSRLNMLDAPGPIHRVALAKTQTEKLGNIHSAFNAAGIEPNNKFVKNLLKDAKTSDDVMRVFSQYAQEYLIPQQNIAKKIVKNYFEDYKVNLAASQKARFNELVSKANKGGD